jgi:pSer/pThr/pTyr-binding forkhead associated (FHA) protein
LIALQIEYLTGPNAGRKLLLRQTCISFGRSPDRTLPIDLPFISREHGEFTYHEDKWQLVNQSPNGTILNGKRVTQKPRPIKATATVTIGDTDVFRVTPMADESQAQADPDSHTDTEPADLGDTHTPKGRTKLWVGIAVFWAVAFGCIAFALLNQSDTGPASPDASLPTPLTATQISDYIAQPIDKQTPNQRQANTALAQAREFYALIDRRPDAAYRAYDAYRNALANSANDTLPDATDQRQYYILQKRLTEGVIEKYESASFLLKSRQYQAADEAFKDLRAFYPDSDSPLFTDALKREAAARDALNRKRR